MRLTLTLCLILLTGTAQALCSGADFADRLTTEERRILNDAVTQTPFASGLIWQAEKGDKSITLIGTMHIYDPRLEAVFARIVDHVANADLLLVEATEREEAQVQDMLASNPGMIFITDGPTLPEQLSEEDWNNVVSAARARSIPTVLVAKMKPWYLSLSLAIPPCAMAELTRGLRGLDHMILSEADRAGIPRQALEPFTTLFDIMQSGSDAEQLEMLQLALLSPELQSEIFVGMLNAYFAENIAEIWETSRIASRYVPNLDRAKADALFAETEQALLIDRNLAWMPVINRAAAEKDKMVIAVGAAHLPGQYGLLALLAEQGWTVTPEQTSR